jgi:Fic family protein
MNETIELLPRHKAIISLLAHATELSREEIAEKLAILYPVSKATLARDLAELVDQNFILVVGNGPSRAYKTSASHPLLKPVDLDQYFAIDTDRRQNVLISFNPSVFDQLHDLITTTEHTELDTIFRPFTAAMDAVDQTTCKRELERFIIELAWKSSKIEGNTYSLLETEQLVRESQEAAGHPKQEAIMILNHKDAFQRILSMKSENFELTLSFVLELHNVLTKDLSIESGIRRYAVGITGTSYRPLDNEWQIRENLEKMIEVVNNSQHPLEKALIVTSMLAYIQPFADGNKRTARMLTNAVLIMHDYFPLSYRSVDENEYKSAQLLFNETNNLYHVKRLFLEQYRFALNTYFV